jgi:hypothetical protein
MVDSKSGKKRTGRVDGRLKLRFANENKNQSFYAKRSLSSRSRGPEVFISDQQATVELSLHARQTASMWQIKRSRVSKSGSCNGGCLVLLVAGCVIIAAIAWGAISTYQGAYQMTSPSPRTFEPVPSGADEKLFRLKVQAAQEAMTRGQATEIRFSASDLNAWFFAGGRNADFADHFRFRTEADWLVADLSVPLSFMADVPLFPSIRSRYFNGRIAARLTIENGELKIQNFDVEGNGKRLPWLFTGQSYKQTLTDAINKGIETRLPEGNQLTHRIESIRVENNEIIVKLRGGA